VKTVEILLHPAEEDFASIAPYFWTFGHSTRLIEEFILETAVEAYVQAQGTEPKGFSTAPQFTKMVNSSMASNG
jgi:hypothetical protein